MVITRPVVTALVVCFVFCMGLSAKPTTRPTVKAKATASKSRTASRATAQVTRATKTKPRYTKTSSRAVRKAVAPSNPGSERIREVQQALVDRGYLRTEPTGSWNAESMEALKRFEAEQKVRVDGKIDSKMLIALGLGPKYDSNLSLPVPSASGIVLADDSKQDQQRN
jgi:peptidoglycan hydrolase-like protein with peptidoglycan-binding domain